MNARRWSSIRCTIWRCWNRRARALDQAAPLAGWQLPECFAQLRRLLEARLRKHGSREYVQVLRLLETFAIEEVTQRHRRCLAVWARSASMRSASAAVPHRAQTAAAGHGELSPSADGSGAHHTGRRLHGTAGGGIRMSDAILRNQHRDSYGRHAAGAARTSSEGTAAAHHPARVRQGGAAVRGRAGGLSTLPAAHDRTGTAGPRAPGHRTPHPPGEVPGRQEPGQLRLPRHPVAEQDAGAGTGAL